MRMMMQQLQNQQQQQPQRKLQGHVHAPPPQSKMFEFLRTKPPVCKGLGTPLDVEDWMRTMERKLEITQCSDGEKVHFTVQQLEGAALDWYENLRGGLDDPEALTFEEFHAAFRDYYVLAGIKELRKEEFRTLQ
ncbi:hypothetical protein E2562_015080 [Oryza meyeriana var. granulata]|uniref:Retrotransposon gag domain-containing protein n=1 Tax=Oryza meyeriana var. granulata TaxID=110450 RepID=A0A6G1DYZ5_9ORYZ|nr:hypothetical protein E2562_015080 [Oryza meyeriana var. granulata]